MQDMNKIALAAAVAGGYLLGRTKKGRLAFTAATYLAGRRFGLEPGQLMKEGLSRVKEMPQFADLGDQLRGEALEAGKKAVTAAANRKLADFADSLHERTLELTRPDGGREDEDAEEEEEPYEDEEAEDYAAEDEDEDRGPEGEEEEEPYEDEEEEEEEEEEEPEAPRGEEEEDEEEEEEEEEEEPEAPRGEEE
ncbi:histone protein, partial [Streptomyces sp. NPDC053755]